ncbi:MAG: integral rane sensor hybrid histidine kinase [Caulobacteraceae bacterium]|nr:integral rane sensor hybrid histidine kinase [Caulobacteraceae bacterium]
MRAFRLPINKVDPRQARIAVALCGAYVLTTWASFSLSGRAVPPFWPCNAFIAAAVVLLGRRPMWLCVFACTLGSLPLMIANSTNLDFGVLRVMLNVGEGLLAGWLAKTVLGPRGLLRTAADFVRLQLLAVLPAATFNLAARELVLRLMGSSDVLTWRSAFLPHLLGMATVLVAVLLLFQAARGEVKRSRLETTAILSALGLVTYAVVHHARLPVAFIVSPLLLMIAFRLGPRGSIFGNLIVCLICLPAAVSGDGPFSLHPEWDLQARALIYQAVCLCSLIGVSLGAFIVAEQARLRRLLVRRAASARDSRRRALVASRAKSDFLATMSHEIRTPMNSILGFTQVLLQDRDLSQTAREHIQVIAQAGGSLMTVLNDILDFSKVEAGQIELHPEPVDAAAAGLNAIDILQGPARSKGLTLRLENDGVDGLFEMDGQRLRQILLNLLNNAVKFTDEGHILLVISHAAETQTLRFEVRDTGIGVEPDVVGRLFARFSQADSSTTRDYGGTGLGLAICKGLVERMGGSIGVESRPTIGSTFWFELPARRPPAAARTATGAGRAAEALRGRVLLVDDHAMNRQLGETLLQLMGCEVDLAESGEEAVAAASQRVYDVILMDVHMPRMDGLQATRAIRALDGPGSTAPIIAMSADVMTRNIERCLQAGMVDHIAKPVQMAVMYEVLRRWMVQARSAA